MSDDWIKASEIGEYLYCQRAWWLRRAFGVPSENIHELEAGQQYHEQHGRLVARVRYGRQIAILLVVTAVAILIWQGLGAG